MEVGARLYLQPKRVSAVLIGLKGAGLLAEDEEGSFRFKPRGAELTQMVEELATLDEERPVTLIKLIYSRPDTLEAFADAFRLRREE